jgi:hypothetical protein
MTERCSIGFQAIMCYERHCSNLSTISESEHHTSAPDHVRRCSHS